jgi:predicted nucleic acid-binding protein
MADTNVYVMAANHDAFRSRFETFIHERGPLLVSSVVVAEYLIGVRDSARHAAVARALGAGAEIVAPMADDWLSAGAALARLRSEVTKGRSFWNDALLAAQCARLGATLVTHNAADFRRLRRHLDVRTVAPFPVG